MTESESTTSRLRINRSMIGRLAAVGLFLGLGTLAVMHTVTNRKPQESETPTKAESTAGAGTESESKPSDTASPNSIARHDAGDVPQTEPPTPELGTARLASGPASTDTARPASQANSLLAPPTAQTPHKTDSARLVPALNAASTSGLPPPPKSFGSPPNDALKSPVGDSPPIVSAQIQVDPSKETTGPAKASIPSVNAFSFGDAAKSVPSALDSPAAKANADGNEDLLRAPSGLSNRIAVTPESDDEQKPATSSTPYDPPALNGTRQSPIAQPKLPVNPSAASESTPNWPGNRPAETSSPQESPKSPAAKLDSTPQFPSSSSSPTSPSESSTKNLAPLRSAIDGAPAAGFGTRALPASTSRGLDSPAGSTIGAIQVMATPGSTALEGPQQPTLTLQKVAPREVQVNKPTELQLVVQNTGQTAANQVFVHDQVPEGTELIDTDPKASVARDGTLSWNLGTIEPGATSKILIRLLPNRPGDFGSVAQVTFAAQASSRTRCTQPILSVKHTAKDKVLIGDEWVMEITVENSGDGPATNVMLQENVPDLFSFADGSSELEFEVGTLPPGQRKSVQLRLKAARVGQTQNRIVAQADADLQASDSLGVEVISPDLKVMAEGPDRKFLNRQATHEFTVANSGTAAATNVDLIARLPRGLKFVSANNQGQYDANSNAVYWSLQQLAAGQSGRVELVTLPAEPGQHAIEFEATADLNQKSSVSKPLAVEYLVELFCEIDDLTDPIEIGGETAYRVKVTNQGLQAATNIRLNVEFPSGIQPTAVSGNIPNQIQGQRVAFSAIDRLDPQQETVVTISAKGTLEGDHRVIVSMASDARETQIAKEESTQVYSDRR
jgi:uncharacterized repeat protein (TIGR01451 family)